MYLSPLTWGTSEMLTDFQLSYNSEQSKTSEMNNQSNFKAKRVSLAKQRNEEPIFVTLVKKITALYPPPPYFPNPLAHDVTRSKLGQYVRGHFSWSDFPQDVDIGIGFDGQGGQLPTTRVKRKRQQLENIMAFVIPFLQQCDGDGDALSPSSAGHCHKNYNSHSPCKKKVVVDFCCGCGHQSIPLAFLFPAVTFILIDTNTRSLDIARGRVKRLKLVNVQFISDNIQNFHEPFDVGISLHACGVATDIAIQKSVRARAMYISIPCCVGKIAHHDSIRSERSCGDITYPRSQEYVNLGCSLPEYLHVAKAADFGHHGYDDATATAAVSSNVNADVNAPPRKQCCDNNTGVTDETSSGSNNKLEALTEARRLSKRVIEQDRNFYARGHNYAIHMALCHPTSCTPKNDILIGIPEERHGSITTFRDWTKVI